MRINELLKLDQIRCPLSARNKVGAIRELADLLTTKYNWSNPTKILTALLHREGTFGGTDFRPGIAFPHVANELVTDACLAVGKCQVPISWESGRQEPVGFVFLLLTPLQAKLLEHNMQVLDGLFSNATARTLLQRCQSKEDVYHLITRIGVDLDVPSGFRLNRFLEGHADVIQALAWRADGKQLASASIGRDHAIRIWDTTWNRGDHKSQPLVAELYGHQGKVDSLAWSRTSARLASSSQDGTIRLWDPQSNCDPKIIDTSIEVNAVAYSPDDGLIVAAGHVQGCRLYDTTSGQKLATLTGDPLEPANCISWSHANHLIAAGGSRASPAVIVWRGYTPYEQLAALKVPGGFLRSVAWSPDGTLLCAGTDDGSILVWKSPNWEHLNTLRAVPVAVTCLEFSHDGRYVAVKYADGTVRLWQLPDWTLVARLLDHDSHDRQRIPLSFDPSNLRLATLGGQGRCVRLWELEPINFRRESDGEIAESVVGSKSVFVVHGRDQGLKNGVARFLEALGLQPVILHERPDQGQTIIEKFEREARVGFAVVLCTADDAVSDNDVTKRGVASDETQAVRRRARQNVIFELGYFVGSIGRSRVSIIMDPGVEIPSDLSGVVYIRRAKWTSELIKALTDAGYVFTQEQSRNAVAIEV